MHLHTKFGSDIFNSLEVMARTKSYLKKEKEKKKKKMEEKKENRTNTICLPSLEGET